MKLIIQNNRIAATATDDYAGPDAFIDAPADFDVTRIGEYVLDGSTLFIPTPLSVTMRQARLALLQAGLLDQVDVVLAAIPDATIRKAAQIEWEFASSINRDSPLLQQLAAALSLDAAALDHLFTAASSL